MSSVPERDWKKIRDLKPTLLSAVCDSVFRRIEQLAATRTGREHDAYLELWDAIREEDKAIGDMFDDLKRSNAFIKICHMRSRGVLTDEHMAQFSDETQEQVERLLEYWRS